MSRHPCHLLFAAALSLLLTGVLVVDDTACSASGVCPTSGDCNLNCAGCQDQCAQQFGSDATSQYIYCRCGDTPEPACCHLVYRQKNPGASYRTPAIKGDCPSCGLTGFCRKVGKGKESDPHQAACINPSTP